MFRTTESTVEHSDHTFRITELRSKQWNFPEASYDSSTRSSQFVSWQWDGIFFKKILSINLLFSTQEKTKAPPKKTQKQQKHKNHKKHTKKITKRPPKKTKKSDLLVSGLPTVSASEAPRPVLANESLSAGSQKCQAR